MKKYHVYFQLGKRAPVWQASFRDFADAREFLTFRYNSTAYGLSVAGNRWLMKHDGKIVEYRNW